jgi:hypothetical protein
MSGSVTTGSGVTAEAAIASHQTTQSSAIDDDGSGSMADRLEPMPNGRYALSRVTGPDEFHEFTLVRVIPQVKGGAGL